MIISKALFNVIVLIVLTAFFFGAYLLENLGVQYVSEGGAPLLKIHVYSYLIMTSVFVCLLRGGPSIYLSALGEFKQVWCCAFSCILFVIFYGLYKQGLSGMAYLVDLIFTPLLLVPLLLSMTNLQKDYIIRLLAYLVLSNACIAILEFVFSRTLIAVEFSNFSHFRSSALLGHPLNNALILASLTMLLMNKTRLPSIVYFFIVFMALFAFGGRGSTAIFLFAFGLLALPQMKNFLTRGVPIPKLHFAFYQAGFIIVIFIIVYALAVTTIGDRILSKLYIDGSAQARFDVFILLDQLSLHEWLFGAGESIKNNIDFFIGMNVIENYLIGWIITFGFIGAIPLFVGIYSLPIKLTTQIDSKATLSVFILFFTSITNNALSIKTPVVLLIVICFACLVKQLNSTSYD